MNAEFGESLAALADTFEIAVDIEGWRQEDPVGGNQATHVRREMWQLSRCYGARGWVPMLGERDAAEAEFDRSGARRLHGAGIGIPRPLGVDVVVRWQRRGLRRHEERIGRICRTRRGCLKWRRALLFSAWEAGRDPPH